MSSPARARSATRVGTREAVGRALRALADENRFRILMRLRNGEECVCKLTDLLDCPQPLLSHHLRVLKEAGLVTDRRDGRWTHYAINPEMLLTIEQALGALRTPAGPRPVERRCKT